MSVVRSHGTDIYYERHGQGPAVLFCHGAGSNAATWWQQIPTFSRHFTCLIHDHRCFGRSRASGDAFEPRTFVDDALAILDAEGIDQAALVCQSLGGITGLRLALQHPQRVWALVACDSPLGIDHDAMQRGVARAAAADISTLEERALARGFLQGEPELTFLYGQINRFNPAVFAPELSAQALRRAVLQLFSAEHLIEMRQLKKLACPTLFVVGTEDPLVTPAIVRDIARHVPGSEVAEVDGAGHSPYFEQAETFNAAVAGFLLCHLPLSAQMTP